MSMMKLFTALSAIAAATAVPAAAEGPVRDLVLAPGKGVSFVMGSVHGVTLFTAAEGSCNLTVALSANPEPPQATSGRFLTTVMPGKPTRIETADGKSLVFECNPDGQSMNLHMPADFKYTPNG